jgi:hypothetical protein
MIMVHLLRNLTLKIYIKEMWFMIKRIALIFAFFVVTSMPISAFAGVEPSPFTFGSQVAGFENPVVMISFAPQPEPPIWSSPMGTFDSDPYSIILTAPNDAHGVFQLAFEFDNVSVPLSSTCSLTQDGINFSISRIGAMQMPLYFLDFAFTDTQTISGNYITLMSEDPQLDFGTNFFISGQTFLTDGETIKMSVQLTDAQGNPVALTSVPEPATMLLLGLGLMGLAGVRRKFRK